MNTDRRRADLVARNTLLNIVGVALPWGVAVVAVPLLIEGLGAARFGLLALGLVVIGYASALDLGVGRAATKYAAEAIGAQQHDRVHRIIWTALRAQTLLGFAGMFLFMALTPVLVQFVLRVPHELREEATHSFIVLAGATPFVLLGGTLRGVLEAAQRFDLVNCVRVPLGMATFGVPLAVVLLSGGLLEIMLGLLAVRAAACVVYYALAGSLYGGLRRRPEFERRLSRTLLKYGGWVTVSLILGPILLNLDRWIIGGVISVAALAVYVPPSELIGRLLVLPGALVGALFPALSALHGARDEKGLSRALAGGSRFALLGLLPLLVIAVGLADVILRAWLGAAFDPAATSVMQLVAVGVLLNAAAHVPFALLQAVGRPDVTARVHVVTLPLHVFLTWFLVVRWGVIGAAAAWTARAGIDAALLYWECTRLSPSGRHLAAVRALALPLGFSVLALVLAFGAQRAQLAVEGQLAVAAGLSVLTSALIWGTLLRSDERQMLMSAFRCHKAVTGS